MIVVLVILVMSLLFVLVYFLVLDDPDDGASAPVTTVANAPVTTVANAPVTTVANAPVTNAPVTTVTNAPVTAAQPAATAPPTTALVLAPCVNGEINSVTPSSRGEVALYQTTLKNLGFDPGDIDGFFGPNSSQAAADEVLANGNINGPNGIFEEIFPDDGAFLPAVFIRLGIACP